MANSHEKMMARIEDIINDYASGRDIKEKTIQEISFIEVLKLPLAYRESFNVKELGPDYIASWLIKEIKHQETVNLQSYWKGYYEATSRIKELLLQ